MHFLVAGLSHQTAPLERLQRLVVNSGALPNVLLQATQILGEAVILSTCNRTEIYTVCADVEEGHRRLSDFLRRLEGRSGPAKASLEPFVFHLSGDDAIRHLFRVTSGLDSLVLGEPEIVNQVSTALRASGESGAISHRLSRLFHYALRANRKIRSQTGIGEHRVSVSSIGVRLLERNAGDLTQLKVLLVGVGETGKLAARALKRSGAGQLMVASRRPQRAMETAAELDGTAIAMSEVSQAIGTVDAIVTCTAAQEPVITTEQIVRGMATRQGRRLFILDLAMPPDVEVGADDADGVHLYGLAALTEIAQEHRTERRKAAKEAEAMVDREVQHFKELLTGLSAEPMIRALGERAETLRKHELERAMKRLSHLESEDHEVLDAMSRAIIKRILADPITYLRTYGDTEDTSALAEAFRLADDLDDPSEDVTLH